MISPVLQQTQQTFVDANGQQFVMIPVNLSQNPLLQYAPANVSTTFSTGPIRGRGQLHGRGQGERFGRRPVKQLGILMLIVSIVHL